MFVSVNQVRSTAIFPILVVVNYLANMHFAVTGGKGDHPPSTKQLFYGKGERVFFGIKLISTKSNKKKQIFDLYPLPLGLKTNPLYFFACNALGVTFLPVGP